VRLRAQAKGMVKSKLNASQWQLPGLQVTVVSDDNGFVVKDTSDDIDLIYFHVSRMRLEIKALE
jgi:hypothetical protein